VKKQQQMDNTSPWEQFRESTFCSNWKWEVTVDGTVPGIVKAIQDGHAIAVSDGSFKDGKGAAAWTIEGDSSQDKITGACLDVWSQVPPMIMHLSKQIIGNPRNAVDS